MNKKNQYPCNEKYDNPCQSNLAIDVVDFRCDFNIVLIFSKSFHSTFVITIVNTRTTEGYIFQERTKHKP